MLGTSDNLSWSGGGGEIVFYPKLFPDPYLLIAPMFFLAEDDYVEVPILLQKMANSASSTECTNNR